MANILNNTSIMSKRKNTEIKDDSLSWYIVNRWRTRIRDGIINDAICAVNKLSEDCLDDVNSRLDNFKIVLKSNESDNESEDNTTNEQSICKKRQKTK